MGRWDKPRFAEARFGQGRFSRSRLGVGAAAGGQQVAGGYVFTNSEAETYVTAMTEEPDDTRKELIDTYIGALKTAGIFADLDLLYLLAAHDVQAARLNVISPATFTLANVGAGPGFTQDRGFTGNGSSTALNTQFTPSTDGTNFLQDDSSIWFWSLTSAQGDAADVGNLDAPSALITARDTTGAGNSITRICDGTDLTITISGSPGTGFFGITRSLSFRRFLWHDGALITFNSEDSTGLPADEQWICGGNGGTPEFSERIISVAAWGASLDTLEEAFYDATLAYLQGVGAVA